MKPAGMESAGALFNAGTNSEPGTLVYVTEARLSQHREDGSVVGSYPIATMNELLHHHSNVAPAAGYAVLAGELVEL